MIWQWAMALHPSMGVRLGVDSLLFIAFEMLLLGFPIAWGVSRDRVWGWWVWGSVLSVVVVVVAELWLPAC